VEFYTGDWGWEGATWGGDGGDCGITSMSLASLGTDNLQQEQ